MSFSHLCVLALRFLSARKWQYFLVFFGIFIGTLLFFIFLSLQSGLNTSLEKTFFSQDTIVSVEKNPLNSIQIDDVLKMRIEELPEVKKVYRETALILPFTFDIDLPFSKTFSLDLYFLYGIEDEFFTRLQEFKTNDEKSIPVLLNPLSIDIINSFVQSIINSVTLSNTLFLERNIAVNFGESTFLPSMSRATQKQDKLFVSGFSSFAPMVGIAIPLSKAEILQNFFGDPTDKYSKLHVEAKEGISQKQLEDVLKNLDLKIKSQNVIANKISEVTNILQIVLIFSSSVTLLLSFLFLFSVFQVVLIEQKRTIGILQAMGMSKMNVSLIFALQFGSIAFFAIVLGVVFGSVSLIALEIFWEKNINLFLFPPEIFSFNLFIALFVIILLISIVFLSLYFIIKKQMKKTILENIQE